MEVSSLKKTNTPRIHVNLAKKKKGYKPTKTTMPQTQTSSTDSKRWDILKKNIHKAITISREYMFQSC